MVSTVDVAGAEAAAILCTQPRGTVLFFSMATSFQSAALFAEGIGSAVTLEIGNGYVEGHAAGNTRASSHLPGPWRAADVGGQSPGPTAARLDAKPLADLKKHALRGRDPALQFALAFGCSVCDGA
jgi:hypothetical protein